MKFTIIIFCKRREKYILVYLYPHKNCCTILQNAILQAIEDTFSIPNSRIACMEFSKLN